MLNTFFSFLNLYKTHFHLILVYYDIKYIFLSKLKIILLCHL